PVSVVVESVVIPTAGEFLDRILVLLAPRTRSGIKRSPDASCVVATGRQAYAFDAAALSTMPRITSAQPGTGYPQACVAARCPSLDRAWEGRLQLHYNGTRRIARRAS